MTEKEKAAGAAIQEQHKGTDLSSSSQVNSAKISSIPSNQDITAHLALRVAQLEVSRAAEDSKDLPIDGLSLLAQRVITTVSRATQSPRDYSVGALMTVAGAAARKNALLVLRNGWRNYPCLWTMAVGDPSAGKTPPLDEILRPLRYENKRTFDEYKRAMTAHKSDTDSPQPQWSGQTVIGDCTPEARDEALSINQQGLLLYRDELSSIVKEFGRYSAGSECETLNSIWVSQGYPVNRKTSAKIYIDKPFMSILGGVQPDMLPKTFLRDDLTASGFTARFLYILPQPQPARRWTDDGIPDDLPREWDEKVQELLHMDAREYRLDDAAHRLWQGYYDKLQVDMAGDGVAPIEQQYLAKLSYHCARWVLIVHLLNDISSPYISANEMEYTLRCMEYFKRTADEVMSLRSSGGDKHKPTQKELIRMIFDTFPVTSQSELGRVLGIAQPNINKYLRHG